nr:MAG TPA: Frog antimicrobial peptide [Caudoviricetes sp.]
MGKELLYRILSPTGIGKHIVCIYKQKTGSTRAP